MEAKTVCVTPLCVSRLLTRLTVTGVAREGTGNKGGSQITAGPITFRQPGYVPGGDREG